jgi:uncharacterized protein (DUF305 family)
MTVTAQLAASTDAAPPSPRSLRTALITAIALAALLLSGSVGYLIGHRGTTIPGAKSVDAGFAWDMSTHHLQAVTMAGYTRDHSSDSSIKLLAYDIETSQFNQVGEMRGWLEVWGLPVTNPNSPMAWMAGSGHEHMQSNGLMPGMASPDELNKLQSMSGKALDVYFLKLMLRHHQGGLPMAQWAAKHASTDYARNAAQKMADSQSGEIVLMEQLLRERGASPLPPPS